MNVHRSLFTLMLSALMLLAVACDGDPTPTAVVFVPPTVADVASPTPIEAVVTPTATSETAAPPTDPPPPPADPAAGPVRINFAPGATSASVAGSVGMNETASYLLNARAGQVMTLILTAPEGNVGLRVSGPTGVLKPVEDGQLTWSGALPADGDYQVDVPSTLGTQDKPFTLSVSIVDGGQEPPADQVVRVNFAPGSTSAVLPGMVGMNERITYLLNARQGQVMTVVVTAPSGNVGLSVSGPLGVMKRMPVGDLTFSGVLPANGDYEVTVASVLGAADKAYTLSVSIVDGAPPPSIPSGDPIRINFAPGASAASVSGAVGMNGTASYLLNARAGQVMNVVVNAPQGNVALALSGPTGALKPLDDGRLTWTGVLPADGDYRVDIISILGAFDKPFTLNVGIETVAPAPPIRVNFAPGATSATLTGNVIAGGTVRYVLGAAAGQRMITSLSSVAGDAAFGITAPNGAHVIPIFDFFLSSGGDYVITVYGGAVDTDYTLEVSITTPAPAAVDTFEREFTPQGAFRIDLIGQPISGPYDMLNVTNIDIYRGGLLRQRLDVLDDTSTPRPGEPLEGVIVEDMNYDGFDDFRIVALVPAGPNVSYRYFIYNPATDLFVQNHAYDMLIAPEFPGPPEIRSFYRLSAASWSTETFVLVDNNLQLTRREIWEVLNASELRHQVIVFDAAGGSTVVVDEVVPRN